MDVTHDVAPEFGAVGRNHSSGRAGERDRPEVPGECGRILLVVREADLEVGERQAQLGLDRLRLEIEQHRRAGQRVRRGDEDVAAQQQHRRQCRETAKCAAQSPAGVHQKSPP